MELEFPFPCPMRRHLFSTMFLTFPQFKYSPAALSGMSYMCAHEDNQDTHVVVLFNFYTFDEIKVSEGFFIDVPNKHILFSNGIIWY